MKFLVLGNWKCHGSISGTREFAARFAEVQPKRPENMVYGLALPYHLENQADFGDVLIGAQNVSKFPEGAYTGEITAKMLRELGSAFCLVGHSERRQYFNETIEGTAEKMARLLDVGIKPVLCIGETLEQRQAGELESVLRAQFEPIRGLASNAVFAVAYEPVWAIGTGVAAKPEDVREAHALIKTLLADSGFEMPVLYGGSVKPENANVLGAIDTVDGFLVGGASLKAESFSQIIAGFIEAKGC